MLLQEIVTFTSTAINLFSWLHRRDGIFSKAWTSRHKGGGGRETASNALWIYDLFTVSMSRSTKRSRKRL